MSSIEKNNNLLLISGPDRSGTTLITLILSAHPKICLSPETNHIPWLINKSGKEMMISGNLLNNFKNYVKNDQKLKAIKIDMEPYYKLVNSYENISVKQAITDYFEYYRDHVKPGAIIIGQKKNYLNIWKKVKNIIPESKILTIFRDCRPAAYSAEKNLLNKDIVSASISWAERAGYANEFKKKYPDDYFEIKYEEFVLSPENVLKKACNFLSVQFSKNMLEYHIKNKNLINVLKGHEKKHFRTSRPVDPSKINDWKYKLNKKQIRIIEYYAGKEMKERGYKCIYNFNSGFLNRMIITIEKKIYKALKTFRTYSGI